MTSDPTQIRLPRSRPAVRALPLALALILAGPMTRADTVTQVDTDALDESSLTQGLHWGAGVPNGVPPAGTAPSAGHEYVNGTAGFLTRTPTTGDVTFNGASLTIANGASLALQNPGGRTTIADLRLDGGSVATGAESATLTLAGTATIGAGGAAFQAPAASTVLSLEAALTDPASGTPGAITLGGDALEGTIALRGSNSYSGATLVRSGLVEVYSPTAFGNTTGGTTVTGTGSVWLYDDVAIAEALRLDSRAIDVSLKDPTRAPQVLSMGNSRLTGPITLTEGPDPTQLQFGLGSLGGTLTVAGTVTADPGNDRVLLGLGGPGNILVTGDIDLSTSAVGAGAGDTAQSYLVATGAGRTTIDGAVRMVHTGADSKGWLDLGFAQFGGTPPPGDLIINGLVDMSGSQGDSSIGNFGSGTLELNGGVDLSPLTTEGYHDISNAGTGSTLIAGPVTGIDAIGAYAGTLTLGAATDVSGVHWLDVDGGGILDASRLPGGLTLSGNQVVTAWGDGTLRADVIANPDALFVIGAYSTARLTIDGDLQLKAGSQVSLMVDPTGSGIASLLEVAGTLVLDPDVLISLTWDTAPGLTNYVLATWGAWDGTGGFRVSNMPSGYELVMDQTQGMAVMFWVPVPAPLSLIAAGVLCLTWRRRARPAA